MCYDYGMKPLHIPVLLDEVLEVFKSASLQNPSSHQGGKIPAYIDCTLGYGGHSSAILECFKDAKLIACDQDENAYNYAKERFKEQIANAQMFNDLEEGTVDITQIGNYVVPEAPFGQSDLNRQIENRLLGKEDDSDRDPIRDAVENIYGTQVEKS